MSGGFEPWHTTAGGGSLATPVSIANGGTGSATQNFVDITTAQAVAGSKALTSELVIGTDAASNTTLPTTNDIRGASLVTGGTADQAGVDITIKAGRGKGAGTPPTIVFSTPPIGTTGTSLTTSVPLLTLGYEPTNLLVPAATLAGGLLLTGSSGNSCFVRFTGGSPRLDFGAGGQGAIYAAGGSAAALIIGSRATGDTMLTLDTSATKAILLTRNVGFTFPANLTPSGTTATLDWSTGSSVTVDAASTTGTLVLTSTNPVSGGRYILKTLGKTGRAWTMPTSLWAGGVKPTVTAVDGAIDVFQFIYDGTNLIGSIVAQNVS